MDFGIGYFPTHNATPPGALARLVEQGGPAAGRMPSGPRSTVERALDRWEHAIAVFAGEAT
ncbi:hypothetical protein [Dactylosporangium sp. NPDC051541]|uniref:hypothetical protein n=1 Tax=Dactylosporangium sp. NPDC051541 TaxID=3363977 RepID=UPI003788A346